MPRKPPNGKRFVKGQSGNPRGSSAMSRQLREVRTLSTKQVAEVGSLLLENNRQALKDLVIDDKASFLQVWTAALMLKGYATGSPQIYAAIMDRIIGKPKETRELSGPDGGALKISDERTDEEKAARAEQLRQMRQLLSEAD